MCARDKFDCSRDKGRGDTHTHQGIYINEFDKLTASVLAAREMASTHTHVTMTGAQKAMSEAGGSD